MDTDHDPHSHGQRDDPIRNLLPTFTPPSPTATEPTPEESPEEREQHRTTARRFLADHGPAMATGRDASPDPTRTGISATSANKPTKVDTAEATKLVIGILMVVGTAAAVLVRWRLKAQLRQPTPGQRRDIATPLARILMRRADMSLLGPDIGDALNAAAATGAYIGEGPLLQPLNLVRDTGLPADLNQESDE